LRLPNQVTGERPAPGLRGLAGRQLDRLAERRAAEAAGSSVNAHLAGRLFRLA
jgi:hypothetical protein